MYMAADLSVDCDEAEPRGSIITAANIAMVMTIPFFGIMAYALWPIKEVLETRERKEVMQGPCHGAKQFENR